MVRMNDKIFDLTEKIIDDNILTVEKEKLLDLLCVFVKFACDDRRQWTVNRLDYDKTMNEQLNILRRNRKAFVETQNKYVAMLADFTGVLVYGEG